MNVAVSVALAVDAPVMVAALVNRNETVKVIDAGPYPRVTPVRTHG